MRRLTHLPHCGPSKRETCRCEIVSVSDKSLIIVLRLSHQQSAADAFQDWHDQEFSGGLESIENEIKQ